MLKAYGTEVIITRTDLPHDHPESYVEVARRIAAETPAVSIPISTSTCTTPKPTT